MLDCLVDNIFVTLFQTSTIGVHIGTNYSPLLVDLFPYSYESECMQGFSRRRIFQIYKNDFFLNFFVFVQWSICITTDPGYFPPTIPSRRFFYQNVILPNTILVVISITTGYKRSNSSRVHKPTPFLFRFGMVKSYFSVSVCSCSYVLTFIVQSVFSAYFAQLFWYLLIFFLLTMFRGPLQLTTRYCCFFRL